jgi:uncharacterized protein (DUF433 family)
MSVPNPRLSPFDFARRSSMRPHSYILVGSISEQEDVMLPSGGVIVKDPQILGGTPVFRGTRVPFKNLLDYLEGGHTLDEFLDDFPSVTREAAIAALERAKELVIAQAS